MNSTPQTELLRIQEEALEELQKIGSKKKDFWDRFSAVSTFMSTVVIAGLGLYLTNMYSERQSAREHKENTYETRILEMQTVEKFIPHLSGTEETKRVALLALTSLGSSEFATKFARLNPSSGADAAVDTIMATVEVAVQDVTKVEGSWMGGTTPSKTVKWVYVGHFDKQNSRWKTNYLDIDQDSLPDSLVEQELEVNEQTGALNVRKRMPNPLGQFAEIINVLEPGEKVKVEEVREWLFSGYIWARVNY